MTLNYSLINQNVKRKIMENVKSWMILVLQLLFIGFISYCAVQNFRRTAVRWTNNENNVFEQEVNDNDANVRIFTLPNTPSTTKAPKTTKPKPAHKLHYFKNRDLFTTKDIHNLPLFGKEDFIDDRIVNQLLYVPKDYDANCTPPARYKKIALSFGLGKKYFPKSTLGSNNFKGCLVNTCTITNEPHTADLMMWDSINHPVRKYHKRQISVVYARNNPLTSENNTEKFDWTATYRRGSDIVDPFGKWEYYDPRIRQHRQEVYYAVGKNKTVAWYAADCKSFNNRMEIVNALRQHIYVDIYGSCTNDSLPLPSQTEFFKMLQNDYKFYLAFETANCEDYITSEVFETALQNNVIPVVMGGTFEEYAKYLPEKSFIHVDDFDSIKSLGNFLKVVNHNRELYNSYFRWKGTGEFIDTKFWCRLCALLHVPEPNVESYSLNNISFLEWWKGEGVCRENATVEKVFDDGPVQEIDYEYSDA